MSTDDKQAELEALRDRVRELETELTAGGKPPAEQWQARGYYTAYYATTGFLSGRRGRDEQPAVQHRRLADLRKAAVGIDPRLPHVPDGRARRST